ncbi:hypothetical protein D9M71_265410 [compost metagenome]
MADSNSDPPSSSPVCWTLNFKTARQSYISRLACSIALVMVVPSVVIQLVSIASESIRRFLCGLAQPIQVRAGNIDRAQ